MTAACGQAVLVLNAGSSSLKFALFTGAERRHHGQVEGIGARPQFVCGTGAVPLPDTTRHGDALARILAALEGWGIATSDLAACGHRLVHAGTRFVAPTLIDATNLAAIDELRELAPLHNGFGLDAIAAVRSLAPHLPQVACFDTAFHASVPEVAARYAIPRQLHEAGYRRFGFHGLNFEHVTTTLAARHGPAATARLLIFHLGNGCSVCAVRHGQSIATTMGYSTLDGLVMGTRSGAIDPGLLIALQRRQGMSVAELESLLYRGSGLLALSGVSSDLREIEQRDTADCRFALEHFCYWAARHAGSLAAALGGVEAVAFTGGIGCHSARVRGRILEHLAWLGLALDADRNLRHAPVITREDSRCAAWIVPADEERAILRHVQALLARGP